MAPVARVATGETVLLVSDGGKSLQVRVMAAAPDGSRVALMALSVLSVQPVATSAIRTRAKSAIRAGKVRASVTGARAVDGAASRWREQEQPESRRHFRRRKRHEMDAK